LVEVASFVTMNGACMFLASIKKCMVYTPVIYISPSLAFLMLIQCPVHFFPTLPFWRACLNDCGVINVTDAPVSYKKRCLCVLLKLRYAHDRSAEMVGSFMFVFIFATILLPNALLSKVVKNAATLNSLEPPYVWENGSSAVTILRWQNPSFCPSSSVWCFVLCAIVPCVIIFAVRHVLHVWQYDLLVSNSF
jgi:hypothetical protein